jgi:16S rRNA (guanine527-N7)-methyltransferase
MTHAELNAAGFAVSPAAHARLARFVDLLLRENQRVNLTAIRSANDVWPLHVCESLALVPLVEALRPHRLLDLGTGGGLPGIPLACVCDGLEVTLLDATRKKLDAVGRIVAELGLPKVGTLWGRAEMLAHDQAHREAFDAVTARAVAPLPTLVEYAAGFVRPGGQCWFAKTPAAGQREVERARRATDSCRLAYVRTDGFHLPRERGERAVVIYAKRAPLPRDLPRRPGLPRRKPL